MRRGLITIIGSFIITKLLLMGCDGTTPDQKYLQGKKTYIEHSIHKDKFYPLKASVVNVLSLLEFK